MKQRLCVLFIAIVLSAHSSSATDFQRDIPNGSWETIFFKTINRLTAKAGWTPLRKRPLPSDSAELRIWIGFGLSPLQGFSLRRNGSTWVGRSVADSVKGSIEVRQVFPKSGWDRFWKKLSNLGVLKLPDSSTLPNEVLVLDGVAYVVEINQDGRYRTYAYCNPQDQKWPEAKKIMRIVDTLYEELSRR